jgi:hypothetical protein
MTARRFKPIPTMSRGVNISDSVVFVEGGLPSWRDHDAEKERAKYEAEKAQFGAAYMASAPPVTPGSQVAVPMADAFTKPLTPPPAPRTVRRFMDRPRPSDADEGGFRITDVRGGLPDWRHYAENKARAVAEYEAQLATAKAESENIASSIAPQSEATPGTQPETQPEAPPPTQN